MPCAMEPTSSDDPILELSEVTTRYRGAARDALTDVSLQLRAGAFTLLTGPSGAGKSTLINLVLALVHPTRGRISVAGRDLARLRAASIPFVRRNVGVVFQDFKLLERATALENVSLALTVLGLPRRVIRERAHAALSSVELDGHDKRAVRCLSGGEQQRVAIARALAGRPALLLADEPTGNLDRRLSGEVLDLLSLVCKGGTTVLLATHNLELCRRAPVTHELRLERGRLVHDTQPVRMPIEPPIVAPTLEAVA